METLKTENRKRVLEILNATLAEPPGSRPAFLAAACGDDSQLRCHLESLLELEDDVDRLLPKSAALVPAEGATAGDGLRIGSYRVRETLGRGGMGTVYKAVREDDFEKQVAIKLLQRDLVSEVNVRRFHNERQILARLEHPAIARLLDGGTTEDGRPYLVMEYVDGVPIDRYCDHHRLVTRERLELFCKVCSALAFAHRSLVVHRDLKPSNILITADGEPKLLDFGIAKLLDPDDATRRDITRASEQPMTPRYASPEQVRRRPIATASDIYSLGTLLYRLLTGQLPCGLENCFFGEVPLRIVEQEPVKPSVVVSRDTTGGSRRFFRKAANAGLTAKSVSRTRDGDPIKLRRCLTGDVDAIVLKALRKDPRRRYSSAQRLAEDIRRHLEGRPVAARRGTLAYRGGKFLRRHRLGVAAAAAVLLLLTAFLVRERQRLEADNQRAELVINVLRGLIDIVDPDRQTEVVAKLEEAREELAVLEAERHPEGGQVRELRSELLAALGRIYRKFGDSEKALETMNESLELYRRHDPGDLSGLAARINNLGVAYLDEGNYDRAAEHFSEALALRDRLGLEATEKMVENLTNVANALLYRGDFQRAETYYQRGLEIRRQIAADDPRVATSLRNLAVLHLTRGAPAEAEPLLREALEIRTREYGDDDSRVASVLDPLGRVRLARGDPVQAERLIQRALDIRRQRLGEEHVNVARSERNLAVILLAEGDLVTARLILTHAHSSLWRARPAGDWRLADTDSVLGALLTAEGRYQEAEPCVVGGYRVLLQVRGEHASFTRDARRRIAELYEAWGREEQAAAFKLPAPVGAGRSHHERAIDSTLSE